MEKKKFSYQIYQLPSDPAANIDYLYDSWKFAQKLFKFSDYSLTGSGEVENSSVERTLENIFMDNGLTVSDIVALSKTYTGMDTEIETITKYYYCDEYGWQDISDRIN